MKNSFRLKKQLTCGIALRSFSVLTFAFCIWVSVATAEPLIKGTDSTIMPSDNSSSPTTQSDPNAAKGERLTPHKYYKGANPTTENTSDGSTTDSTYRNEATGTGTVMRSRNRTPDIGTGTSYKNEPVGTGTSYKNGTPETDPSDIGATTSGSSSSSGSSGSSSSSGTSSGAGTSSSSGTSSDAGTSSSASTSGSGNLGR